MIDTTICKRGIAGMALILCAACTSPRERADETDGAPAAEIGSRVVVPDHAKAVVYRCSGNTSFTMHMLTDTAWVELPERTVRLPRDTEAAGTRYSNGDIDFTIEGGVGRLETEAMTYTECR